MSQCDTILELISAKLDHELTKQEDKLLSEHLAACSECRTLLNELTQMHILMLKAAPQAPAPIKEHVMASIHTAPVQKTAAPRHRKWLGLAAACAIILVAAGVFQQGRSSDFETLSSPSEFSAVGDNRNPQDIVGNPYAESATDPERDTTGMQAAPRDSFSFDENDTGTYIDQESALALLERYLMEGDWAILIETLTYEGLSDDGSMHSFSAQSDTGTIHSFSVSTATGAITPMAP